MPKTNIHLVIDADYIVYAAGFSAEHNEYAVMDDAGAVLLQTDDWYKAKKCAGLPEHEDSRIFKHNWVEPKENAFNSVNKMILAIREGVVKATGREVGKVTTLLSGSANYRDRLATIRPYKGNRDPRHKPALYRDVRKFLIDAHSAEIIHWMEADDAVSILQTADPDNVVVAGIDKDLLQVPGMHYVPGSPPEFLNVTVKGGLCRFYLQLLMGDTTDNIAGVYKVGKVAATKIVKNAVKFWKDSGGSLELLLYDEALTAYEGSLDLHGEDCGYEVADEALLENARLLYMLRDDDYNHPSQPNLWLPPTEREPVL